MNKINLFLKGFIIGLGKIIPGVSGAMFAILFGVYEDLIESISSIKSFLNNYKRLIYLILGIILAIIFGSGAIRFLLNTSYSESMSFFLGIMSFGLVPLVKEIPTLKVNKRDIIISFLIVAILIFGFSFDFKYNQGIMSGTFKDYISLFLCGILDAISTIIPGISGTSLLMLVGYYEVIIDAFANIASINMFSSFKVLIPFLIGMFIGLVLLAIILKYLFKNYKPIMKLSIVGFVLFSLIMLAKGVILNIYSFEIVSSLILFGLGFFVGYLLESKFS